MKPLSRKRETERHADWMDAPADLIPNIKYRLQLETWGRVLLHTWQHWPWGMNSSDTHKYTSSSSTSSSLSGLHSLAVMIALPGRNSLKRSHVFFFPKQNNISVCPGACNLVWIKHQHAPLCGPLQIRYKCAKSPVHHEDDELPAQDVFLYVWLSTIWQPTAHTHTHSTKHDIMTNMRRRAATCVCVVSHYSVCVWMRLAPFFHNTESFCDSTHISGQIYGLYKRCCFVLLATACMLHSTHRLNVCHVQ